MYCLFCDVLCIVCVYMCTELLPPGCYPIAVKYIISYHTYLRGPNRGAKNEMGTNNKKKINNNRKLLVEDIV
jgi:hypothetical protein